MKVIILCSNYEPGGAQRVSFRLTAALNERGIETSCWFLHRRSSDFSKEHPRILYDKKISNVKNIVHIIIQLIKIIKNEKPDIIISFLKYANTLGLIIAFFLGIKIRVASHRAESTLELSPVMRFIDFSCAFLGIYTSITAVSYSTKLSFSYYTNNCYNRIKVIHNGLDFSYSIHSKESCRDYFKLNKNDFIVGTVGRLVSSKNHKFLLNILPFIGNVQLVIVGEGELKLELIDEAKELGVLERLTIINQVKTMDIPMFLNAIDLYVMPTLCEGLSNALLEALYAGLPILSSDIPSQREVLHRSSDGLKAGVLIDLHKTTDWINEVRRIKDDENYRISLHENALMRAQDFTVDRMVNGYISLFNREMKS